MEPEGHRGRHPGSPPASRGFGERRRATVGSDTADSGASTRAMRPRARGGPGHDPARSLEADRLTGASRPSGPRDPRGPPIVFWPARQRRHQRQPAASLHPGWEGCRSERGSARSAWPTAALPDSRARRSTPGARREPAGMRSPTLLRAEATVWSHPSRLIGRPRSQGVIGMTPDRWQPTGRRPAAPRTAGARTSSPEDTLIDGRLQRDNRPGRRQGAGRGHRPVRRRHREGPEQVLRRCLLLLRRRAPAQVAGVGNTRDAVSARASAPR